MKIIILFILIVFWFGCSTSTTIKYDPNTGNKIEETIKEEVDLGLPEGTSMSLFGKLISIM